jgi:hypothetical protein
MGMVLTLGGFCRGPRPARGWGLANHHGHSCACGEPGKGGSEPRQHTAVPGQGVSPRIEKEKKGVDESNHSPSDGYDSCSSVT